MLSNQLMSELKTIIREDYKKDLTKEELSNFANSLVAYFRSLNKIKSSNKDKNEYKERKN